MHRVAVVKMVLVITVVPGLIATGCDEAPPEQEAATDQQDPTPQASPPLEGPFEGAHDGSPVPKDEFGNRLVDSICLAYDHCRNDELKVLLFEMVLGGAIDHPPEYEDTERAEAFGEMVQRLNQRDELVADRSGCEELVEAAFVHGGGLDGDTLQKAEDAGTIDYDAATAGECLARFGEPFGLCTERTTVDGETPNPDQVMATLAANQHEIADQFGVCDDVFEGKLEEEEPCRHTYECMGGTTCQVDPEETVGKCLRSEPSQADDEDDHDHDHDHGHEPMGPGGMPMPH